ncbi:methylated-DNA--[protein]-cysteine S-methyltransferase [Diaphorobacter aerolatus]|uniref:Methylated-DNA--protein-cysteine methyltransferase n=1 Tax=Diaphorobacter aerolatus TaxID=1288495 RepID=A0A7H0GLK9_9BURK|nr:methylated-DNA--[protein]-cysteine S-methyltransferase [Diaphorobacter aerolatus]QNP49175.1 methylated-DNA--[protein]-cysteine S-methyltransferase [Diaphorobacter aerolatus]
MTTFASNLVCTRFSTTLGDMYAAASDQGLIGLWFHDQRHLPHELAPELPGPAWKTDDNHPVLVEARRQVQEFFDGQRTEFDLALDLSAGTPFQQSVWQALLDIPRGKTTTYGSIARGIGKSQAVRAVGAAVGRNPLSLAVPCHRVLGQDGSLTGYAGGLDRKIALLRLEGAMQQSRPEESTAT